MNYDELLELKKEIDELSLYYLALKEKYEEIDEMFYSNNLLDLDEDEKNAELVNEETIDDKIREGRSSYNFSKLFGYSLRYLLILVTNRIFGLPQMVFISLVFINVIYYSFVLFGYERIIRKKLKSEAEEKKIDFEALAQEKKDLERCLEYVRDKYYKLSAKYEKLVSKLGEDEYHEYLDYISEYLQFMLEHSKEMLKEASKAYMLSDYDIEMDYDMGNDDEENQDDVNTYRLK